MKQKPLPSFTTGCYTVRQVAKAGIWLVTAEHGVDLGMLFLRAQEFYESGNAEVVGRPFSLLDYQRWYSLSVSDLKAFTYCHDFEGFNIPSESIARLRVTQFPDPNHYDITFAWIASCVQNLQGGRYYLVGALASNVAVAEHELCHGLYDLIPAYREAMDADVARLPDSVTKEIQVSLAKEGYSDAVMVDEIQAYMATGLLDELSHLEKYRHPFMKVFARYRRRHIRD